MSDEILKILQQKQFIQPNTEFTKAVQTQQNSAIKEKIAAEEIKNHVKVQTKSTQDNFSNGSLIPHLCISKQEYEGIISKRPLIKFRPVRNTFIKSSDKALLAESLNIPKSDIDKYINETIDYLLYKNPASIYYDGTIKLQNYYTEEIFRQILEKQNITKEEDIKKQELLFYQQPVGIMGDYIYRHGSKTQLLNYMKLQLSDAKSMLKQLYNILDTECGSLMSYFVRPIHVLDNHSVVKMHKIVKDGLSEAQNRGYISKEEYSQNVQWALEKIYAIQSNTTLREALRTLGSNQ